MLNIFTFSVLFTDTAKKLYEKFGFVSESEIPNRKIIHKLRLQDKHPEYMKELMQIANNGLPVFLNEKQSMAFLFENKRVQLYSFWKSVSVNNNESILHPEQLSEASDYYKRSCP